ncbi:MAG: hypothetical protein FJ255_01500 [Phycisphaerae bacterium]|nr:hypothetical protein [Phycisphaerae bacterium]
MLTFTVFDRDGRPARGIAVESAWTFGTDDVPLAARVRGETGRIVVERDGPESTGLCLLVELDPATAPDGRTVNPGALVLKTSLLPERREPYLLTLELLRHAIMLALNKLEEWDLFDIPETDPDMAQLAQGRRLFTDALIAHRMKERLAEADRLAREALSLVVDACERLTLRHAERALPERLSGRLYARTAEAVARHTGDPVPPGTPVAAPGTTPIVLHHAPLIGCTVNPAVFDAASQQAIALSCDFVGVPLRWSALERSEGKLSWGESDRWIEWAVRTAKLPVVAGPLVDFRPASAPDWLYIWENDYETLRDLIVEHIQAVVTRYRRAVARWTVTSGLNANGNIRLTVEQTLDLTRIAVMAVRRLHPTAQVQVEVTRPFGEYHAKNRRSLPPLVYAELLVQAALPIDALALRLQAGQPAPGQGVRDAMTIAALIDRMAALGKPVVISALGAPAAAIPVDSSLVPPNAHEEPEPNVDAGRWHGEWSPQRQADWLAAVALAAASQPAVHSICWQEVAEGPGGVSAEMPFGGLIAGAPRPALARLAETRNAFRDGRVPPARIPD